MKIVVSIPALNEEAAIGKVVSAIPRDVADIVEIVVVDDGSTDNTSKIAKENGANVVIKHRKNKGLGKTFRDGINQALKMGADIIVTIDGDGQFNPNDISTLIKPIVDGEADMVSCSRFKEKSLEPRMSSVKKFGNKFFAKMVSIILGKKYYDTQCGFRAYSRKAAMSLILFGKYTYVQEVFIDLAKKGFVIKEIALKIRGERAGGKSRLVKNVISYGIKAVMIIVRSVRDYQPFKFFGVPGLILVMSGLISSLILFVRWLMISRVDPFLIVAYANVIAIIVGTILIIFGLLADMIDRTRSIQEQILYKIKKKELEEMREKK
jgi:glycosyltransferase involved in cell wall biosynthesis